MVKKISDNEIYLLIKYIKSILWRVVKRLSYIEEARCLKVNVDTGTKIMTNDYIIFSCLDVQHVCHNCQNHNIFSL